MPPGERSIVVTVRLPEWVKDVLDDNGGSSRLLRRLAIKEAGRLDEVAKLKRRGIS